MNIKIIGAIMCVVMMSLCTITVSAEENAHKDKIQIFNGIKLINDILNKAEENDKDCVQIVGPVSKLYTKVTIENNLSIQNLLIKRNANRRLLRISMFLPFMPVLVENLNFKVTFKKDVENTSRYLFYTFYGEPIYDENKEIIGFENESEIRNHNHTIEVKNFTGLFVFKRARIREKSIVINILNIILPDICDELEDTHKFLFPARIGFIGFYDELIVS